MPLDCMTCMAMSGNGAWITGMTIIEARRVMVLPGSKVAILASGYFAAVRGMTVPHAVGLPIAAGVIRAIGTTSLVFELSAIPHGLCRQKQKTEGRRQKREYSSPVVFMPQLRKKRLIQRTSNPKPVCESVSGYQIGNCST